MPRVASDISGQRFGRLVAVRKSLEKDRQGAFKWVFLCDCGREFEASRGPVTLGRVKSCGCLMTERLQNATDRRSLLTSQLNLARREVDRLRSELEKQSSIAEAFRLDNMKLRVELRTLRREADGLRRSRKGRGMRDAQPCFDVGVFGQEESFDTDGLRF